MIKPGQIKVQVGALRVEASADITRVFFCENKDFLDSAKRAARRELVENIYGDVEVFIWSIRQHLIEGARRHDMGPIYEPKIIRRMESILDNIAELRKGE